MFEISLVPEVKAKLLRQERIRNFVIIICIFVAIGCGAVLLILSSVITGQGIALSAKDHEIACRIGDGSKNDKNCKNTGVAVMKTDNLNEMLSVQNQMNNIGTLNQNKVKFSRVFPMLSVLLIDNNGYSIKASEVNLDFASQTISFDAVGYASSGINSNSLAAFKASANTSYFDYGDYIGINDETNSEFTIPSFCITELKSAVNGYIYGIYHRYTPGCEADMVTKTENNKDNNNSNDNKTADNSTEVEKKEPVDVFIRRTYKSTDDMSDYKSRNNAEEENKLLAKANEVAKSQGLISKDIEAAPKGFYFSSKCVQYDSDGDFSEEATRSKCPISPTGIEASDFGQGRDENDTPVFSFSVTIPYSKEIFSQSSHHVVFNGPTRKNVTPSYKQFDDMFVKPAKDVVKKEEN